MCESFGCSLEGGLGSAVQGAGRQRISGSTARDVDDGASLLCSHDREGSLQRIQGAEEVSVHLEGCVFLAFAAA